MSVYEIPEVLQDTYKFQFKDLVLHQRLKSWQDKIAFRLAVHRYLKRDGAELEHMGREAGEFIFNCFYLGPTWRADYAKLVNSLSDNPLGKLIHPLLGPMDAGCDLLTSGSTPAQGRNLVEFTLQFREDRVDQALAAEDRPTPSQLQGKVTEQTGQLSTSAASYSTSSQAEVASLISKAITYASLAAAAANSLLISPQVSALLQGVGAQADLAIKVLLADPLAVDAAKFPVLTLIEQVYATCIELDDAVRRLRPQPETKTVHTAQGLISLCEQWYGKDALAYMDLILTLNRIPNPFLVPAGTVLVIPPPTLPGA